ncbi:MAG: hypothetical protein KJ578_08695 [Bacteroidetes bacterium]|nr:hypothetical protein [Bacteroidota bacterium]MBU1580430.1 hypothetical protein [Bacteroidota bacterium]MBU2466091.1 hypothetical protein [Bacteroidota bacterium]MBU2557840.1 hypothetical protein [Bacteroidota bacterium]
MMRQALFILFVLLFCGKPIALMSQESPDNYAEDVDELIIYNRERSAIIQAHTLGYGIAYRPGKNVSALRTFLWNLELITMKSPKQIKIINPYYNNSKRYVYGKLNDVFMLRGGYGLKKQLNRKPYWGGIELRWLMEGGISVAFEKPYYYFVVNIEQGTGGFWVQSIDTRKFDDFSTSTDNIYGRAPFTRGLNEIAVRPGIYLKTGLNFEFGYMKTQIKALEAGAAIEVFPQGISIMDDERNQRLFITFYLSFGFGKRYNKY